MRKLWGGGGAPNPPKNPALISHNKETSRRIRTDSAGVLKYETPGSR